MSAPSGRRERAVSRRRPLLIGLTGPIGCGKSTLARWLAARGAVVVDADLLARSVVRPGEPAHAAVVEAFGSGVLDGDGQLDRAVLAARVFAHPDERRRLEAITSPAIRPRIDDALAEAAASGAEVVALEAIRLVEAGYATRCDEVWLVTCDPGVQRSRLIGRGMDAGDADARIAAQAGIEDRVAPLAARVVDTSGPIEAVEAAVAELLEAALERHRRRRRHRSPGRA